MSLFKDRKTSGPRLQATFDQRIWLIENDVDIKEQLGGKDEGRQFVSGLLIAPKLSQEVFASLLLLTMADAAHMTWGACSLFSVYGQTSNHEAVALVHGALVSNEDEEAWTHVFKYLKERYPDIDQSKRTLISDQDKGMKAAQESTFQYLHPFFCGKHRGENVRLRATKEGYHLWLAL